MREIVWAVIGLMAGWRSFIFAERDVLRLRKSGETFGAGRSTEVAYLSIPIALISSVLWFRASEHFDHQFTILCFGLLISVGLRLLLIDIDTHLLPRGIVFRATAIALPMLFVAALLDSVGSIAGMLLGALIMWSLMKVLEVLSRGDLGGGDVNVSLLLGLYLGWLSLGRIVTALVIAFASAGLFALLLLVFRRAGRRTHIAFGPFLIAGALFAVLR